MEKVQDTNQIQQEIREEKSIISSLGQSQGES